MTESEWFTVVAPETMLAWVAPRCSERKLRLFAAACCRRVAHRCRPRFDSILHRAEAIADASDATGSRKEPMPQLAASWMKRHESGLAHALSNDSGLHAAREASERAIELAKSASDAWWEERWFQAAYLCDIIGNPFRGVAIVPEWRTSTVVAMARQMYESLDFSAMPILADASRRQAARARTSSFTSATPTRRTSAAAGWSIGDGKAYTGAWVGTRCAWGSLPRPSHRLSAM